ncbi:hypothetical protein PHMEG_00039605 [Phytophthora megakarya]|uniref:Uncharacterized protein n=1 Tax=Phytophthora megakarya TaxID=4795 RepID=A0A225UHY1_9STRA|nr:hypothetical protein PHMEG_00039605 [Phytophthora megakarya]
MVNVNRPRSSAFTPAQVSGFYFRPCRDDYEEVIAEYCGGVGWQKLLTAAVQLATVPRTAD